MTSYVLANPSKSNANPSQCNANFMPFPRAICPHNLGTSALYGIVSSPLGGRNSCYPVATQCKSEANPWHNPESIWSNPSQSSTNPVPIRCQFFDPISGLQFPKTVPTLANSCQSQVILSFRQIANLGQSMPILRRTANTEPLCQSV